MKLIPPQTNPSKLIIKPKYVKPIFNIFTISIFVIKFPSNFFSSSSIDYSENSWKGVCNKIKLYLKVILIFEVKSFQIKKQLECPKLLFSQLIVFIPFSYISVLKLFICSYKIEKFFFFSSKRKIILKI